MTWKDLQRVIESQPTTDNQNQNKLQKLKGLRFWGWETAKHKVDYGVHKKYDNCCFNHTIGPCKKDGVEKPFYDYEKLIFRALFEPGYFNNSPEMSMTDPNNVKHPFKDKHLFIKKSTGLGISEFIIRIMAWLATRDDTYKDSQMVIVVGPNWDLAVKLIKRMKGLFTERLGVTFDTKETIVNLNGCNIESYPSNHLESFRSLSNPKFIFLDECDYFRKNEQEEVRITAERYIGKSAPFIVMVSTPNRPDGLFASIEKEPFDTCIYKKMFLDYLWGVDKIYSKEEIEAAKMSPSFPREYQLQYQGIIGNVFSTQSLEACQQIKYNPNNINPNSIHTMGIDPGFGSSNYAIVATQFVDGKIQIIFAEEYERPNFVQMIDRILEIRQKCGYVSNVYVDASAPSIWEQLKKNFDEPYDIQYVRDKFNYAKKYNVRIDRLMTVIPVPFQTESARILENAKWLMEELDDDGCSLIAIHKKFDKLLTGLRTAVAHENKLDKENTVYDDLVDAFRLALITFKRSKD